MMDLLYSPLRLMITWKATLTRSRCLFLYSLLLASAKLLRADRTCVKDSNCRCTLNDNSYYFDLAPIVGETPPPMFTLPEGDVLYYYDPCRQFDKEGSECRNVAACKEGPGSDNFTNIGLFSTAEFVYLEGQQIPLRLVYHNGKTGKEQINTTVQLICDTISITALSAKQSTSTYYLFELRSRYACMLPVPSSNGLSTGGVLCIVFVVLVAVYFGGGFVYLFFFKYESGKKAIPHYEFWSSLPGLIRDGSVFLCECMCGKSTTMTSSAPSYEAI